MADGTVPHVVRQGEHIYTIAMKYGVTPADVWSHPGNAALRKAGRSPTILAPGDVVIVPKLPRSFLSVDTGATNSFVASVPTAKVSFRLLDEDDQALANEAWECLDPAATGTSDGDGTVKLEKVPLTQEFIDLHLPARSRILHVKVGHLDPVTTASGKAQRLGHLGYISSPSVVPAPAEVEWAFEWFRQTEAKDASAPADVEQALVKAHGA